MEGDIDHPKLYLTKKELLTLTEILEILQHPDSSKASYVPPAKPRGGDVYVFSANGDPLKVKYD